MAAQIHTATYNGKTYCHTKTQWIDILNTNVNALDKLLKKLGTMQAVINTEFSAQQKQRSAVDAFLSGRRASVGK